MQKGSKQWYDHMAKELKHHTQGMKYVNSIPKLVKMIQITNASKCMAKKFSSKTRPEFESIENQIDELQKQMIQMVMCGAGIYLGVKVFFPKYIKPLFEIGGYISPALHDAPYYTPENVMWKGEWIFNVKPTIKTYQA